MDNPGEILRLCRLCLVKDQVNIPIFEEQGDIRQTFLKIRSCLPVKVSRDDKLPKKICGGCSNKLDLFYEFWSSTANSEKTLQSWLGQEEEDDKMQEITKPVEALVKEESEALEDGHAHDQSFDEATKDEAEAPPAKRARRTAAVKAQINISHDSDEDEDVDGAEPITKIEDESDDSDGEEKDPSYTEVPGTSADDQAGPSGLGKDGVEAPSIIGTKRKQLTNAIIRFSCGDCCLGFKSQHQLLHHFQEKHIGKTFILCKGCSKDFQETAYFASTSKLNLHCKYVHYSGTNPISKPSKCMICEQTFSNSNILQGHQIYHHFSQIMMQCYICRDTFVDPKKLKNHGCKGERIIELFVCGSCGKTSSTELEKHVQNTHSSDIVPSLKCNFCEKMGLHVGFIDGNILKGHLIACHSDESAQMLKRLSELKKTPRADSIKNTTLFVCGECGQINETLIQLEIHVLEDHKSKWSRKFTCNFCASSDFQWYFLTACSLNDHIVNEHENDSYEKEYNSFEVDLSLADKVLPLSENDIANVALLEIERETVKKNESEEDEVIVLSDDEEERVGLNGVEKKLLVVLERLPNNVMMAKTGRKTANGFLTKNAAMLKAHFLEDKSVENKSIEEGKNRKKRSWCKICKKIFQSKRLYKRHMKTH
ncbi:zinc finger protein 423-like isoform X9 [Euwallacea similis]|uniref:zinc finger protein 423-like isoform X9 n=1 Tax=Euwallacea similis TaxID=1736056 RepID=UPI00344B5C09